MMPFLFFLSFGPFKIITCQVGVFFFLRCCKILVWTCVTFNLIFVSQHDGGESSESVQLNSSQSDQWVLG